MDPNFMQNMMGMMNNPKMMKQINTMMQTPEIQNMLKDPSLMNNILGMMNNSNNSEPSNSNPNNNESIDINLNNEESYSDSDEDLEVNQTENTEENNEYNIGDHVIILNLKNQDYNNKIGIINSFISETNRYCIRLQDSDKVLSVKPSNLEKMINID